MPRGRRVNSSGEKSKKLLQEKAIELFSINGYHNTKISDIVKSANLTQPTFYLYFESKDSIYNDLIQQFKDDFVKVIEQYSNDHKRINHFIKSLLEDIFKYFAEKDNLTKIAFDNKESAQFVNEALRNLLVEKIEGNVGEIKVNSQIFVESLLGTIERLTLTTLLTNTRSAKDLASDIMDIYFFHSKELV